MEQLSSQATEVGAVLASVLLLIFMSSLQWIEKKLKERNSARRETDGLVSVLEMDERINEYVTELRVKLDADRVHFSQPHNGTHFASIYPMYKLSRTHESCALGISYRRKEMSQVKVSEITQLVSPIILGSTVTGAKQLCDKAGHDTRVIGFSVSEMDNAYEKFFLESMLINYEVATAIWVDGDLYGFLGVDFCTGTNHCPDYNNPEWICRTVNEVRTTADMIGYIIREGKKKIKAK